MQIHDITNESFRHYTVKHKRTGKKYRVTAMHDKSAIDKAKAQHGGTASRFSGTSTDDFEIVEGMVQENMIGKPDDYYDAEERTEAYNKMQDDLDRFDRNDQESIMQGICPGCGGNGYMDGEEEMYNDETDEYEEGLECDGVGIFGCDQGEITGADEWKDIMDHDERQKEKNELANKPQPKDEELERAIEQLHKEYVKSGRVNAFELPSLLRQMYPEISKGKAREIGSKFFKSFQTEEKDQGSSEGEMMTAKMLAKALGDENRWAEMSASELYSELESESPKKADMIALVAKMLYDVKLTEGKKCPTCGMVGCSCKPGECDCDPVPGFKPMKERAYKNVGVADVVKDKRGKEFKFDKSSKEFKSIDGEKAAVSTKLGQDLMRLRKNMMKKSTPSYNKKKFETVANEETYDCDNAFFEDYGYLGYSIDENDIFEAEYRGRKVKLNKPMQGDVKKFKVYVKDPKTGNVKKVNFGHGGSSVKGKAMKIRKNNPKARKSFRARHNCDNPGPKTKARYWSCRKW